MYKRKTYRRRRPIYRRKKAWRPRTKKKLNSQQKKSYAYIRKRYTRVFTGFLAPGESSVTFSVSHIGANNSLYGSPSMPSYSLPFMDAGANANNNNTSVLDRDMTLYQYFKITGCAWKVILPNNTPTAVASAASANDISGVTNWECGYSMNEVFDPNYTSQNLQALATY